MDKRSDNLYNQTVESLAYFPMQNPFPVMRVSGEGELLFANDACSQLLSNWNCSVGKPVIEEMRREIAEAFSAKGVRVWEIENTKEVYVFTIVPIHNGQYANIYGFNITSLKSHQQKLLSEKETLEHTVEAQTQSLDDLRVKLEEEIKIKKEKEEALHHAKRLADIGVLSATVAHELRNPLGVIETALYNIRRKRTNDGIDRHVDVIEKKIGEAAQIITNLLLYTRIKDPEKEKSSIMDLLNDSANTIKQRFKKYNISTVVHNALSDTTIFVDPLQIKEVFNNILINSYQAYVSKEGSIEISLEDTDQDILIRVVDYGTGIDNEVLEHVFEPFFTKKSRGTGLGLSICRELVNLHKGNISIQSKKNSGTTVHICLPKQ